MCNKEHIVGYLYEELSAAEKAAFEAHVRGCVECRQEVSELRQTREHLALWSPPEPEFNLSIVRTPGPAVQRPQKRWAAFIPQWGLAAAAALIVLAGAAAIANLEVRYTADGSLVVRTGWAGDGSGASGGAESAVSGGGLPGAAGAQASEGFKSELAVLHRRLDALDQAVQQSRAAEPMRLAGAAGPGISPPELRKILAESEARQRTEMAARIAQIWNDFNAARVNDWARLQQAVVQAQGLTNRQLQQQRETIDSLRYMQTVLHK